MSRAIAITDVERARQRIRGEAVRTPLLSHPALDARAGGRLFVKAEPLQRTGSFKFRGAFNRISQLDADERRRGVVAFSSGNHAQGVALAASLVGCPAVIVMPRDAPALKIAATRSYGAEVILYDRLKESREAIGERLSAERGAILVKPYDDPDVMAGQGTMGLEIVEDLAAIGRSADAVAAGASGGGLMAGLCVAFNARSPATRLYVTEPSGFDDHALSLRAGRISAHAGAASTLCDALMAPQPGELTFPITREALSGAFAVSDREVLEAMGLAFLHLKLVIEPGGATALAAALRGDLDLKGGTGVVIASGGNVDPEVYQRVLASLA